MSAGQRLVQALGWQSASTVLQTTLLFGRSVILARLLPVETFGIYAGATVVVELVAVAGEFGLGGAFLQRSSAALDEEETATAHFTLTALLALLWGAALIGTGLFWLEGANRTALITVTLAASLGMLARTPRLILTRRISHRRLAALDLVDDLLTSVGAVGLALAGATLWALLATNLITTGVLLAGLYLWRPVWRPRLAWNRPILTHLRRFGLRNMVANLLAAALDRGDDLFTRLVLGEYAMGLYSRAWMFATYPRRIVAAPVAAVAVGGYAAVASRREALSRTFFRLNALLVRGGFLLSGALALVAPEFVLLLIGEKWLPFVPVFRLMLIFTLVDPLRQSVADLFVALGRPEQVVRARLWQLVILVAGLLIFGRTLGITGVALAVDLMAVTGLALLLHRARTAVDFSSLHLFGAPLLALLVAGGSAWLVALRAAPDPLLTPWLSGGTKLGLFVPLWLALVLAFEWRKIRELMTP